MPDTQNPSKARLSEDGRHVTLSDGRWSEIFPVTSIDSRLDLYRRLRDRKDGKYAQHYRDTVVQLERVKRAIEAGA